MVSVINTVDTSHDDMIHDAQVDYYGTRLATCSSDKSVKIFDVTTSQHVLVATLIGHDGPVWQLAWAHPVFGSILATCGYDKKVIIWKECEGTWLKLYEHSQHESSVNSVCWAPYEYGLILASGSSDGSIIFLYGAASGDWEMKKIKSAHSTGCNAVSWAPSIQPCLSASGDQAAKLSPKRLVSGGCDNLAKIWREESGSGEWVEEQILKAHCDWVRDVAWAPSLSLMRSMIGSCSQDQQVFIWTNDGSGWTSKLLHKFNDVVWHLSWSITGNVLAVSGGDNKVSLWKENSEGQWSCISNANSNANKGQGDL